MKKFKLGLSFYLIILSIGLILTSCSKQAEEAKGDAKEASTADNLSNKTTKPPKKKYQTYSIGNKNTKKMVFEGNYLWIGTSKGLIKYDTRTFNSFEHFHNKNGLLSNGIFSITIDKDGNKWIGTYGGGLSVYNNKEWKNYNVPDGLCDSFVYDVHFAKDNSIWIATWSGANRIIGDITKRSSWERYTVENTNKKLGDNWVYGIEEARNGDIWLGTEVGISLFTKDKKWGGKWAHNEGMGAPLDLVKEANSSMTAALSGSHHSGQQASAGLLKRNVGNYNPNYVVAMKMDSKNKLWIGTWGGGVSIFDGSRFKTYTSRDGLAANYILSLEEDPLGNMWIGTNKGLSKFDGREFTNYSTKDGLFGDFIFAIAFAPDGSLWTGGWKGISHIYSF